MTKLEEGARPMRDPAPDLARIDGKLVRILCPRTRDALVTDGDSYAWVPRSALEVAEVTVAEIAYLHRGGEVPCDTEATEWPTDRRDPDLERG